MNLSNGSLGEANTSKLHPKINWNGDGSIKFDPKPCPGGTCFGTRSWRLFGYNRATPYKLPHDLFSTTGITRKQFDRRLQGTRSRICARYMVLRAVDSLHLTQIQDVSIHDDETPKPRESTGFPLVLLAMVDFCLKTRGAGLVYEGGGWGLWRNHDEESFRDLNRARGRTYEILWGASNGSLFSHVCQLLRTRTFPYLAGIYNYDWWNHWAEHKANSCNP